MLGAAQAVFCLVLFEKKDFIETVQYTTKELKENIFDLKDINMIVCVCVFGFTSIFTAKNDAKFA